MADKKVMYKLSRPETHGDDFCVWKDFSGMEAEFDGAGVGEILQIEIIEMTDEEFDDLGEFDGW